MFCPTSNTLLGVRENKKYWESRPWAFLVETRLHHGPSESLMKAFQDVINPSSPS